MNSFKNNKISPANIKEETSSSSFDGFLSNLAKCAKGINKTLSYQPKNNNYSQNGYNYRYFKETDIDKIILRENAMRGTFVETTNPLERGMMLHGDRIYGACGGDIVDFFKQKGMLLPDYNLIIPETSRTDPLVRDMTVCDDDSRDKADNDNDMVNILMHSINIRGGSMKKTYGNNKTSPLTQSGALNDVAMNNTSGNAVHPLEQGTMLHEGRVYGACNDNVKIFFEQNDIALTNYTMTKSDGDKANPLVSDMNYDNNSMNEANGQNSTNKADGNDVANILMHGMTVKNNSMNVATAGLTSCSVQTVSLDNDDIYQDNGNDMGWGDDSIDDYIEGTCGNEITLLSTASTITTASSIENENIYTASGCSLTESSHFVSNGKMVLAVTSPSDSQHAMSLDIGVVTALSDDSVSKNSDIDMVLVSHDEIISQGSAEFVQTSAKIVTTTAFKTETVKTFPRKAGVFSFLKYTKFIKNLVTAATDTYNPNDRYLVKSSEIDKMMVLPDNEMSGPAIEFIQPLCQPLRDAANFVSPRDDTFSVNKKFFFEDELQFTVERPAKFKDRMKSTKKTCAPMNSTKKSIHSVE